MDPDKLKAILEGALLAVDEPLSIDRLERLFGNDDERPARDALREALATLEADCAGRGVELKQVASGWRYQARQEFEPWVSRLWEERPPRYSRALLETLALIAYRQPITRSEIEEIRGVSISQSIMKTLLEREWVRIVGHREVPGRPALYGSTRQFLDYFNLKSLSELPPLAEIANLDKVDLQLGLETTAEPESDFAVETVENEDVLEDASAQDLPAEERMH